MSCEAWTRGGLFVALRMVFREAFAATEGPNAKRWRAPPEMEEVSLCEKVYPSLSRPRQD